jgi:hypothetical protein
MPRTWEEYVLERLVTISLQSGDRRLATAKLHRRRKSASFLHAAASRIECAFGTNRIAGNLSSQVVVIECEAKRGTDIECPLLERELKQAHIGGDVHVAGGTVLLQYRWGFGRDQPFPLHDPRRVQEVIDWAHAALRVLFAHLERRRDILTTTTPSSGETATAGNFTLALEKYLEDLIVSGWNTLEWGTALRYLGRQVPAGDLGNIDILARERESRDYVVIELKKGRSDDEVVGQLSRYMGWIREHRASPDGVGVRGIIVVHEVTPKLRAAAMAHENVELYTYALAIAVHAVASAGKGLTTDRARDADQKNKKP